MDYICNNISLKGEHLAFAGQDVVTLAERYGTPLYLLDENKIREKCRIYIEAFKKYFPEGSLPSYASKANSFKQIYRIMSEEGMGVDVVSGGELYTAKEAGFDLTKIFFHSNNKTEDEIEFAIKNGIGFFVVDGEDELEAIDRIAGEQAVMQKVLLRLTPGIDTHTYEKINTGKVDSKFGRAIETGDAEKFLAAALACKNIEICGYHCHVGSQVFAEDVFERAAEVMLEFAASMRDKYGYAPEILDLGGGYGVAYVETDADIDIAEKISEVAVRINEVCARLKLEVPKISMEPGRSIVADAGMTLYTCGSIKHTAGYKYYVSIDGGMTDNPRYALYESKYTCINASRAIADKAVKANADRGSGNEKPTGERAGAIVADLVGRCCESGDIIQPKVAFPKETKKGDIIAVCTTGAYNYSMASNYNRVARPPIVMLKDGDSYVAVKRESYEDICRNDV